MANAHSSFASTGESAQSMNIDLNLATTLTWLSIGGLFCGLFAAAACLSMQLFIASVVRAGDSLLAMFHSRSRREAHTG